MIQNNFLKERSWKCTNVGVEKIKYSYEFPYHILWAMYLHITLYLSNNEV